MNVRKPQTIFRNASAANPYTMVLNDALQDCSLSADAGWILVLCLSLPRDWCVTTEWLMAKRNMGRDRVRNAIKELVAAGYCRKDRMRKSDGTLGGYAHLFTDRKGVFGSEAAPAPENPSLEQPAPEIPAPVKPHPIKKKDQSKEEAHHKPSTYNANPFEGCDELIPFEGTDGASLLATASHALARQALPAELQTKAWLPFSTSVLVKISKLCLDREKLILRYLEKTKGKKIKDPSAYLMGMALDAAAKRDGVDTAVVAGMISEDRQTQAEAMAASVGYVPPPKQHRGAAWRQAAAAGGAVRPNGAALVAALGRGHA